MGLLAELAVIDNEGWEGLAAQRLLGHVRSHIVRPQVAAAGWFRRESAAVTVLRAAKEARLVTLRVSSPLCMAAAASYSCPLSCSWSAVASGPPLLGVLAGLAAGAAGATRRPRPGQPGLFVYGLVLVVLDMPLAALAGIAHDVRSAPGIPHPIP